MFLKSKRYIFFLLLALSLMATSTTTITAKSGSCKLSSKTVKLKEKKAKKLVLKENGKTVKKKIKWKSSNKSVATVSSSGKIKAKKMGFALVTATYNKNKYFCVVYVSKNTSSSHAHSWSNRNVCTKDAWDEKVLVKDAWDEQVPEYEYESTVHYYCTRCNTETGEQELCPNCGHGGCWCETGTKQVLVGYKTVHHDAEYKTVHHDAESHTEKYCTDCGIVK